LQPTSKDVLEELVIHVGLTCGPLVEQLPLPLKLKAAIAQTTRPEVQPSKTPIVEPSLAYSLLACNAVAPISGSRLARHLPIQATPYSWIQGAPLEIKRGGCECIGKTALAPAKH
jgi:hypothetical protein